MTQNASPDCSKVLANSTACKGEKEPISNFRRGLPQFCVVGVKNLILLGWGLILGYPTILIPGLQAKGDNATSQAEFELGAEEISWIGSINLLFVPFGSITSALFMDLIGKRRMMQLLNLPMIAAWTLFYFANSMTHIYIGLCLMGMSGGLLEAPLLLYIAETVEPKYRGMLTASGTATVLGGVFLQFVIGGMFHWRTVAAVSVVIPFLACNAVFLVPETPYWLYANDRVEAAHKSLQWLRGWVTFDVVEEEFNGIKNAIEDLKAEKKEKQLERQKASDKLKPFTKRTFFAPFFLIVISFVFGHFSGMTPLQTYAIDILSSYKVPINEYYATIYLGMAQFIGCVIGMVLVRMIGKRRIVFISFIGCAVCFFAVATQAHCLYGSNQRDFDSNKQNVNNSIQHLEENVFEAAFALRDLNQNDSMKLTESDHQRLKEIFKVDFQPTNVSQFAEWMDESEFDIEQLFDLLNMSKIILRYMPHEENKTTTTQMINKIEQSTWDTLKSDNSDKMENLQTSIDELSSILSEFANGAEQKANGDENALDGLMRWFPLIILLAGTMFAHLGAKLFPWMLIGEVYPYEIRSASAGVSSALNYFIGFLSNKLFLNMVAAFTLNGTFWFYSAVAFIALLVLYFILPETEGKTLEEVQAFFDRRKRNQNDTKSNHTSNTNVF